MVYSVQIGNLARRDMAGLFSYITDTVSLVSANRWSTEIIKRIRTLAYQPERFPLDDQAVDLDFELRVMLHGNKRHVYRILFTIDGQTVNVLRIRHAAQDSLTDNDF